MSIHSAQHGSEGHFQTKKFPNDRDVRSFRRDGSLLIQISPVSNWRFYAFSLVIANGFVLWVCAIFLPAVSRIRTWKDAAIVLPFPVFLISLWWWIAMTVALE